MIVNYTNLVKSSLHSTDSRCPLIILNWPVNVSKEKSLLNNFLLKKTFKEVHELQVQM